MQNLFITLTVVFSCILGNTNDPTSHPLLRLHDGSWLQLRFLSIVSAARLFSCMHDTTYIPRSVWLGGCVLGGDMDKGVSSTAERKRMWSVRPKKD